MLGFQQPARAPVPLMGTHAGKFRFLHTRMPGYRDMR